MQLTGFTSKKLANAHVKYTINHPEVATYEISDTCEAVANAIRRVLMSDIPVKSLRFDATLEDNVVDFTCTDAYMNESLAIHRVRSIPVHQSIPIDKTFSLDVKDSHGPVTSHQIKGLDKYCEDLPMFTVRGDVSIKQITVEETRMRTSNRQSAIVAPWFAPVGGCVGLSSMAAPTKFKCGFETNGTIEPKKALDRAIAIIQSKLDHMIETVDSSKTGIIKINGEGDTLGNLACYFTQDADVITYRVDRTDDYLELRIEDPNWKTKLVAGLKRAKAHL